MNAYVIRFGFGKGVLVIAFLTAFGCFRDAGAVPLKGSNGKVVEFAEILSAGPQGLKARLQAGGAELNIGWEKLDLEYLKTSRPEIFSAYEKALKGETTAIDLSSTVRVIENNVEELLKPSPGRYEMRAGNGTVVVQLPEGSPKGILLLSWGQDGNSSRYLGNSRENSHFRNYLEENKFAIATYQFPDASKGSTNMLPPYVDAKSGSGKALMEGIEKIGKEAGEEGLRELPMVVYGLDIPGGAFAYNFTQEFPDHIVATVAAKGAYYSASPTPESLKVPVLFVWGEYDQDPDLWNPKHRLQEVMEKYRSLKPCWIDAMEPRAPRGETPAVSHLVKRFFETMLKDRLDEEGKIKELDRTKSWMGDLKTFAVSPLEDAEAPVKEEQTWLPNEEFAKLWNEFTTGTMTLPGA